MFCHKVPLLFKFSNRLITIYIHYFPLANLRELPARHSRVLANELFYCGDTLQEEDDQFEANMETDDVAMHQEDGLVKGDINEEVTEGMDSGDSLDEQNLQNLDTDNSNSSSNEDDLYDNEATLVAPNGFVWRRDG